MSHTIGHMTICIEQILVFKYKIVQFEEEKNVEMGVVHKKSQSRYTIYWLVVTINKMQKRQENKIIIRGLDNTTEKQNR